MVRWRVRERAEAQGYDTAYRLALAAGLPYTSVKAIWDGRAKRIDLETLGKLAAALSANLGDLFEADSDRLTLRPAAA